MSDRDQSRNWIGHVVAVIVRFKSLAPYALIELILPGGTVMALLLWLYRRRKNGVGFRGFLGRPLRFLPTANLLHSLWRRVSTGSLSALKVIVSTTRHLGIGWV